MFGYVIADKAKLSVREIERYKSIYCGLCQVLKEKYHSLGVMSLDYDMVFMIMLLSSLYEYDYKSDFERCAIHPIKKQHFIFNAFTEYAADINIILKYWSITDNVNDEKKLKYQKHLDKVAPLMSQLENKYPIVCQCVEDNLSKLNDIEKNEIYEIDRAARYFGKIMRCVFVQNDDVWSERLSSMAENLGKFIYTMDAACDYEKDVKKSSYNPLRGIDNLSTVEDVLNMQIAECAEEYELLPLVRDKEILDNILYSGVWQKYEIMLSRKRKNGSL